MLTNQATTRVQITASRFRDAICQREHRMSLHHVLCDDFRHLIPGQCQQNITGIGAYVEGIAGLDVSRHSGITGKMANSHYVALRKWAYLDLANQMHCPTCMQVGNPWQTMPILHRTTSPSGPIRDRSSIWARAAGTTSFCVRNMWSLHRVTNDVPPQSNGEDTTTMPNHSQAHLEEWNTELRRGISRSHAFFRRTLRPGTVITEEQAKGLQDLFALVEDVLAEVQPVREQIIPNDTLHKIVTKQKYKNL